MTQTTSHTSDHLIFHDGLSTHAGASDLSGRGVGLAALRAACEAEGGQVEVASQLGRGVTFTFVFGRPLVDTRALATKLAQRWMLASHHLVEASGTMRRAARRLAV